MKRTVLNMPALRFKARLRRNIVLSVLAVILLFGVSAFLLRFRTDSNHRALLLINIICDTAGLWLLYGGFSLRFLPELRLLGLAQKSEREGETAIGRFEAFNGVRRVEKFDCLEAVLQCPDGKRRAFVIEGTLEDALQSGRDYRLHMAGQIVVSCEDAP